MTNPMVQAYKQAPWRTQIQWIGIFLLALLVAAGIASIYLNVSANAAAAGRQIQDLEEQTIEVERSIADLETNLAQLTSAATMGARAKELGFAKTEWDNSLFVTIPGYSGRQAAVLAPPPDPGLVVQPVIRQAYTQSLWDWIFTGFVDPVLNYSPVQK